MAMALSWGLLLASACSASAPPGGREAAGPGDGSSQAAQETAPAEAVPAPPATADQAVSASRRATPASRPLPPDRFVTRADDGRVLAMRIGESRELRVRDPDAPDPTVEGDAVELLEIDNVQAAGGRGWELRAARAGRSRIVVAGDTPFAVTIAVAPR